MRRYLKLASICGIFLLAVSLSAFAGSIDSFSGKLTGVSNSSVSGSFSLNSQTGQFSNVSISFVSSVLGSSGANPGSVNGYRDASGQWAFIWWGLANNGDLVLYDVSFLANGTFQAIGGISDWQGDQGNFNLMAPEGGAKLTYLMLSAIAVFGGILVSGRQRRSTRTGRCS